MSTLQAVRRILERIDGFGPRMQAAARYVADHPHEIVVSSMRSVALSAGAQPATLVRLAQALGFSGWPGLKALIAQDLGLGAQSFGQRAERLKARRDGAALAAELFAAQRANLDETGRAVAPALRTATRVLLKARQVHIAGFRASFPVAYALYYGWRLFRPGVALIDGSGGALEMHLRHIGAQDAVIAISFAPYSREALQAADAAAAAGARLVVLTDSSASPLARQADVTLPFAVRSPSFFPSVAAGVAVAEALLEALVAAGGDAVIPTIQRAERQLFEMGAYVLPPVRRRR